MKFNENVKRSHIYILIRRIDYYSVTGAIFTEDQKDSPSELAFKYAVYRINKDKSLLPNTTLVYDIQYVPKDDSFRTSKKGEYFRDDFLVKLEQKRSDVNH